MTGSQLYQSITTIHVVDPTINSTRFQEYSFVGWIPYSVMVSGIPCNMKICFNHPNEADTKCLLEHFNRHWKSELARHKRNGGQPYLWWALIKCIWWRLLTNFILFTFQIPFQVGKAFFLGEITDYLTIDCPTPAQTHDAYLSGLGLSLLTIILVLIMAVAAFIGYKNGMLLRVTVTAAIYNKILSLSQGTVSRLTIGHIVNLSSNDVHRLDLALVFYSFLLIGPTFILVTAVVLYYEIGVVSFIAVAMVIGQIPVQVVLSRLLTYFRLKAAKVTDSRVKVMNEVITGIRVIKMYGWENAFHQLVSSIRHNEMMIILKSSVIRAVNLATYPISLVTMMFTIFSVHAALGEVITLRKVFITLSLLSVARNLSNFVFLAAISHLSEAMVAIKRIQEFLLLEDLHQFELDSKSHTSDKVDSLIPLGNQVSSHSSPFVTVSDLCSSWYSESSDTLALKDVSFSVTKDHPLLTVVGSVGAGKSTLLQCLLGELPPISGNINMEGSVAYAGQEPWVFSDTLRENILFGQLYSSDWYDTVIELCALDKDINILPDGDLTLVGERGVTLSGGQKARVGLARAVYRRAGVYLLDDPLSAVDAAVSRHIFDRCIKGCLTNMAVVILVTHQLQYVKQCDTVLVLNKGCVSACGAPSEVLEEWSDIVTLLSSETNDRQGKESDISRIAANQCSPQMDEIVSEEPEDKQHNGEVYAPREATTDAVSLLVKVDPFTGDHDHGDGRDDNDGEEQQTKVLLSKEERGVGSISYRTYHNYFKAGGGSLYTLILFTIFILAEVSVVVSDGWLASWASEGSMSVTMDSSSSCNSSSLTFNSSNMSGVSIDTDLRVGVYGGLVFIVWVLCLARTMLFYIILLRAATLLHNKMFLSVLRSPILFFDTNPVGRILNRFSKDIGFLDDILIFIFCEFLQFFTRFLAIVITSSIAVYYLIPVIIAMVAGFIAFRWYFLKTSREIKRLESLARSPLYSHISMTLQGLPTIRAYGKQTDMLETFYHYQNRHTQAWYLYITTTRWFGLRVDVVCAIFVSLITFVSVPLADVLNAGFVALALTYTFSLTGNFQYCVRESAEVESLMVSAERVMEYGNLISEESPEKQNSSSSAASPPFIDWPSNGRIEISNLSYKHSSDGPLVLNDINCVIKAGEKVGIVGRTGAGKSSLIAAFFRLAQPSSGSIKIDGIECLDIQLQDLRPSISIIPQDPVLFSGSVRYNLDPFDQYDDNSIWKALEQVQLGGVVKSLDGGLGAGVTEGGNNFSVGERQLFCLARALLRHNKILMLDEATANVDLETDSIIQLVIREHFNECTVLTIAHRLDTVMDSDRIMVLRGGELAEFGEPYELLSNPESYLLKLVEQTGTEVAEKLKQIALTVHNSKIHE